MNKIEAIDLRLNEVRAQLKRLRFAEHVLEAARAHALSGASVSADGSPTLCTGCGADVSTERQFSEHYVIPNPNLYNLGHCPTRDAS